jgi:hypothetical protein
MPEPDEPAVPEFTPAVPEFTPAVPEFTPAVPEFTPAVPEFTVEQGNLNPLNPDPQSSESKTPSAGVAIQCGKKKCAPPMVRASNHPFHDIIYQPSLHLQQNEIIDASAYFGLNGGLQFEGYPPPSCRLGDDAACCVPAFSSAT